MKWRIGWMDAMLAAGAGLLVVGLGVAIRQSEAVKPKTEVVFKPTGAVKGATQVYSKATIDIGGAVTRPGVYELDTSLRIKDVMEKCGGLSEEADKVWVEKNINLAEKLRDGEKIYIPHKDEKTQTPISNDQTNNTKTSKIISINNATLEELDTLEGVGPSIGQKIIDYREKNGGFQDVEEIKLVAGVGDKMYEKIKDRIAL